MRRSDFWKLATVIWVVALIPCANATDLLKTSLEPGPHGVGFRVIKAYDAARSGFAECTGAGAGRPIQLHVWYPAEKAKDKQPFSFGHYLKLLAQDQRCGKTAANDLEHGRSLLLDHAVELGGERKKIESDFSRLADVLTTARQDAKPARGHFPLLVWPAYRSPAMESVMSEYFASHGIVVVGLSLKGTFDLDPEISVAGLETLAQDIGFAVNEARRLPMVSETQHALIGVGINASGALCHLLRNSDVDALVSLDGGIPTAFEDGLLRRTPYFDVTSVRAPILAIWAPHPNVNPALLDAYRYSPRYVLHFPKMREYYFLNFGVIEKLVPKAIGEPAHDPASGFEAASRHVLSFLQSAFKGDAAALQRWSESIPANPDVAASVKPAVGEPLTLVDMKQSVAKEGVPALRKIIETRRTADPELASPDKLRALANWLAQRDPDWSQRKELASLRIDLYPTSSRAHFTAAQVAKQRKELDLARRYYEEALRLVETDSDPALDGALREQIRNVSRTELDNIEKQNL